ncbi:Polygalacturonase [Hibiscus syriacus]|uniref:Polygalacturonase n=1 Tax=Hibiscus syriacus TaxID=106335 RepID=A0A6A2Y646_HIBSY|nr:Polygalacturonase [Hibiscus syriacus]
MHRCSHGDDCISIVSGSQHVTATNTTCGPGHGISIGSLGSNNSKALVFNVTVDGAKFSVTTNGVRIKTWQGGSGSASKITFQNIEMNNVKNPIIIDQNYCDQSNPCHEQSSAVQIENVVYNNINGTSSTEAAINFNCSSNRACQAIVLQKFNPITWPDLISSQSSWCRTTRDRKDGRRPVNISRRKRLEKLRRNAGTKKQPPAMALPVKMLILVRMVLYVVSQIPSRTPNFKPRFRRRPNSDRRFESTIVSIAGKILNSPPIVAPFTTPPRPSCSLFRFESVGVNLVRRRRRRVGRWSSQRFDRVEIELSAVQKFEPSFVSIRDSPDRSTARPNSSRPVKPRVPVFTRSKTVAERGETSNQ